MTYDTIIIGSGPGGYVAAIRCAQLGMKTALIERYDTLGGTCLNVGCIPSKALLDSSKNFYSASHKYEEHGIQIKDISLDMERMMKRKESVVDANVKGIAFLMKKNKVDVFHGHGSFVESHKISINADDGKTQEITGKNIIIATGSKPVTPDFMNYDKDRIITSTEALKLPEVPKKMVVIGGGVIGLEMGSVYARLGTSVEVVEYMDSILTGMDQDCAKQLQRSLKKLGIKFHLAHKVTQVKANAKSVTVTVEKRDSETSFTLNADYCLIAIGRRPYTHSLGLDKAGITTDDRGRIPVDEHLRTQIEGVYAIGDVIRGAMLAHKAEEEGVLVAETIAGQSPHIDYNLIPGVVYTWPELAGVGKTEEVLKEAGTPYKTGTFPYKALGRSRASGDLDGMVKVIAHQETDEILGVHMVGARAADIIAEAVVAMEYRASAEDIARMSHAHPTYTEALREAALAATADRAIHM